MERIGLVQDDEGRGEANARRCRRWLIVMLSLALVIRVGAAFGLQWMLDTRLHREFLIEGDSNGYWDLGEKIATGQEYALYDPPRRILRMPGFPLLLASSRLAFGHHKLPARLLLALVGTGACGCVWWLGRELIDGPTGLWAVALAAVSPALVGFTPVILSETPFALTLLLSLIAGTILLKRHRAGIDLDRRTGSHGGEHPSPTPTPTSTTGWLALVNGLAIAIAVYFRPSWLLAGAIFGVMLLLASPSKRVAMRDVLLIHVGLLLGLLPWTIRNYQVSGEVVLTSLWMGPSLYDGWNPVATGDSDMQFFDRENVLGSGMSEYEMNRHYSQRAIAFAKDHPGRVFELGLVKLWRYWKPWPNADQFSGIVPAILLSVFYLPMLVLAVHGGWLLRSAWWKTLLAAGPILYFAALHTIFVSSLRYRLPAEYPMLILSAVSLRSWILHGNCCKFLGNRLRRLDASTTGGDA